MRTFQFTCAVRIEAPETPYDGELMPIEGLVTPLVRTDTVTEAMLCLETTAFCEMNKCVVYERVRSWAG